jgi:glycosyltransferase involved in cell wall biosynthesis
MNARQPTIMIIFPMDPLGKKVGGAEAFLKSWIRSAPSSWRIEFVGIDSSPDPGRIGQWHDIDMGPNKIRFLPVCGVKDENKRHWLPLSLRFTFALWRQGVDTRNKVLLFNRLEPAILFINHPNPKAVIVHSDLKRQHTKGQSEVFWRFMPGLYHWLESLVFRNLQAAYTVSRATLEHWQETYPQDPSRFNLIATCVDTELFTPPKQPRQKIREAIAQEFSFLKADQPWILFVGRLQTAKAPDRVIEICQQYLKHHARACFILAGEGDLREDLQEKIRQHSLEESVFLTGSLNPEQLRSFYQASDVLLLTSHYEGMPLCVLEALACGLPVVATDVGELKSVIESGKSGELIGPYSPQDMASMVARVSAHPETYSIEHCESAAASFTPRSVFATMYQDMDTMGRREQ